MYKWHSICWNKQHLGKGVGTLVCANLTESKMDRLMDCIYLYSPVLKYDYKSIAWGPMSHHSGTALGCSHLHLLQAAFTGWAEHIHWFLLLLFLHLQTICHRLDCPHPFFSERQKQIQKLPGIPSNKYIKLWRHSRITSNISALVWHKPIGKKNRSLLDIIFLPVLTSPHCCLRERCAQWQWSTVGNGWQMCWAGVFQSSLTGILWKTQLRSVVKESCWRFKHSGQNCMKLKTSNL